MVRLLWRPKAVCFRAMRNTRSWQNDASSISIYLSLTWFRWLLLTLIVFSRFFSGSVWTWHLRDQFANDSLLVPCSFSTFPFRILVEILSLLHNFDLPVCLFLSQPFSSHRASEIGASFAFRVSRREFFPRPSRFPAKFLPPHFLILSPCSMSAPVHSVAIASI